MASILAAGGLLVFEKVKESRASRRAHKDSAAARFAELEKENEERVQRLEHRRDSKLEPEPPLCVQPSLQSHFQPEPQRPHPTTTSLPLNPNTNPNPNIHNRTSRQQQLQQNTNTAHSSRQSSVSPSAQHRDDLNRRDVDRNASEWEERGRDTLEMRRSGGGKSMEYQGLVRREGEGFGKEEGQGEGKIRRGRRRFWRRD